MSENNSIPAANVENSPDEKAYHQIVSHVSQIAEHLEKKFALSHVTPILLSRYGNTMADLAKLTGRGGDSRTYYQAWFNGKKIFIKHGALAGSNKTEFEYTSRLHGLNKDNFPEALFYSEDEYDRCIATEFLEGKTLESTIRSDDFSPVGRESIILQLKNVAKSLLEAGVTHRDAGADNFIVTKEGKLKLIDFGGAIESGCFAVRSDFRRNSLFFRHICVKCTWRFHCCDVFVLPKMLERIGCQENYQQTYREVESFLKEQPEVLIVRCKYRRMIYAILLKPIKFLRRLFGT